MDEDGAVRCGCCGEQRADHDVSRLGRTPEVAVCVSCLASLLHHRRDQLTADHPFPGASVRRSTGVAAVPAGSAVSEDTIPILHVRDAAAAIEWYGGLGFRPNWEHRFEPGLPAFVSLLRGQDVELFLSEHMGDARPDALVWIRVADVDTIAAEFGATVSDGPAGRGIELRDLDGNRIRLASPA